MKVWGRLRRVWKKLWQQDIRLDSGLIEFSYATLRRATRDFSIPLERGTGAGKIYRGALSYSTRIVVDDITTYMKSAGGHRRFCSELESMFNTLRDNYKYFLIPCGYCIHGKGEKEVFLLVLEYIPGATLDMHLFQDHYSLSSTGSSLDFDERDMIATMIARALDLLHSESTPVGNLKPENIIIEMGSRPRLSDYWYGWGSTDSDIGPEFSVEGDVYAYGMMVLELISGIRNSENESFPSRLATIMEAAAADGDGDADMANEFMYGLLDQRLLHGDTPNTICLRLLCDVAYACIQHNPSNRPTMSQVHKYLKGEILSLK